MEGVKQDIMTNLRKVYGIRRQHGKNSSLDQDWITAPKNLAKCKLLGMDPLVVLHELEAWHDENKC